ncbi:MAG: hypothetical protein WA919_05840 [Coleofasciculaceae cyanobacterium]
MADTKKAQVRIIKGSMKGYTGKISACNSDGFYFVSLDSDIRETSRTTICGPFLSNEFEQL